MFASFSNAFAKPTEALMDVGTLGPPPSTCRRWEPPRPQILQATPREEGDTHEEAPKPMEDDTREEAPKPMEALIDMGTLGATTVYL